MIGPTPPPPFAPSRARFVVRTRSRVDTGGWGRRTRLWVAVTDTHARLFADGQTPYRRDLPLDELHRSFYNHVTGCVVLAGDDLQPRQSLRLPPATGRRLLDALLPEPAPCSSTSSSASG